MKKEPIANNVPYIVGCNNTEGCGIMVVKYSKDFKTGITKETYDFMLQNMIGGVFCVSLLTIQYTIGVTVSGHLL